MKNKIVNYLKVFLVLTTLLLSKQSFSQDFSRGLVPDDFVNNEKMPLLCVYNDQTEYEYLKNYFFEYFKGNYKLVSLNEFLNEEEYKDKKTYRYMFCKDVGDVYNENDGKYQGATYYWCIIDRENHIRNLHLSAFPMDQTLTDIGKKLEKKRTK